MLKVSWWQVGLHGGLAGELQFLDFFLHLKMGEALNCHDEASHCFLIVTNPDHFPQLHILSYYATSAVLHFPVVSPSGSLKRSRYHFSIPVSNCEFCWLQ